jgi:hypothetical protein
MPLEGLDEEGLPKNPDLSLVQLKFLLTSGDDLGVDREKVWEQILTAVKENCKPLLLFRTHNTCIGFIITAMYNIRSILVFFSVNL